MLSWFAKFCFTVTAVAPACGAAAIAATFQHKNYGWGAAWVAVGLLSLAVSWMIVTFAKRWVEIQTLDVVEIEQADQRVLEFLIAYSLPLLSSVSLSDFAGSIALTLYSLLIVSLIIATGNMFQFNPVLLVMGYHFYAIKSKSGIPYLLITKKNIHKANRMIHFKKMTEYVLLETDLQTDTDE